MATPVVERRRSDLSPPASASPGKTAIAFEGSAHASLASNSLFEPGLNPFSLTLILKGLPQAAGYCWLVDKMGADGWVIQTKTAGDRRTCNSR